MSSERPLFAQLLDLLEKDRAHRCFDSLMNKLRGWDDPGTQEEALALAEDKLAQWDDDERWGHFSELWPDFPEGEPSPLARLIRSLYLAEDGGDLEGLRAFASSPCFAQLAQIDSECALPSVAKPCSKRPSDAPSRRRRR